MTRPLLLAALFLVAMSPAWAQPAVGDGDKAFLVNEAQGSEYEKALAQLAQQKATRPDVKAYADRLVSDHAAQNAALAKLTAAKGVTPPVGMADADHSRLADLANQGGPAFDAAFAEEAVRINAEDKKAADAERSATGDADIKAFLGQFESMDAAHEQAALALRGK